MAASLSGGRYRRIWRALRTDTERLTLRWSLRSEMRLLVGLAGLRVVADYGDFRGGPPAYGREQVWVLANAGR